MSGNLVKRKVLDRRGRWVSRWVRADTPEVRRATIPAAGRPEHTPSPVSQHSAAASDLIYGDRPMVPRYAARNLAILAEFAPGVLDRILTQCSEDDQLREVWGQELAEPSIPMTRNRTAVKAAINKLVPLLDSFPRTLALIREACGTVHVMGAAGRSVRKLHGWTQWVVQEDDAPSPGQLDVIYLLGLASSMHVIDPVYVNGEGPREVIWPQSLRLEGRVRELSAIVPELQRRGTIAPEVIDALLEAEAPSLRDGEL